MLLPATQSPLPSRPLCPLPAPDWTDLACWVVVPIYDAALCYYGGGSLKPLAYILLGMYLGVGLHPIAGG